MLFELTYIDILVHTIPTRGPIRNPNHIHNFSTSERTDSMHLKQTTMSKLHGYKKIPAYLHHKLAFQIPHGVPPHGQVCLLKIELGALCVLMSSLTSFSSINETKSG